VIEVFAEVGGNGDQIHAEGLIRLVSGPLDLIHQHLRGHVSPGQHTEGALIGYRGYQSRFGNPGHGSAQNGIFYAEELFTPAPQSLYQLSWHDYLLLVPRP
jgi:hypothetical protein